MFRNIGIINRMVKHFTKGIDFFKVSSQSFIGIYISENYIFCVQIRYVDCDRYEVVYAERINIDFQNDAERKDAVEALDNSLNKAGIFERKAVLYIDDRDVYCYQRNIHEFDSKDLSNGVHWDLEANEPFDGDYVEGYSLIDDTVVVGAVCRQDIAEYTQWLRIADINVYMAVTSSKEMEYNTTENNITFDSVEINIPDNIDSMELKMGGINALYAAASAIIDMEASIKFWLEDRKLSVWRWDRISACILCVVFLLSAMSVGVQEFKKYEIDNELNKEKESLCLLSDVLESKQRAEAVSTEIENRMKLLKDLSKDSWPVYAILVHLGCINCDGVWLTDLSTDKGVGITLKGETISYNSLVKYYQSLEADKDFFSGETSLEKSDLQDNGNIVFQIKANLK